MIKDWIKIKKQYRWTKPESYEWIIIKKNNEVLVQSEKGSGGFLTIVSKSFETKSAALTYVRNYMRKH